MDNNWPDASACISPGPAPQVSPADLGTGSYQLGSDCLWHFHSTASAIPDWSWYIAAAGIIALVVLVRRLARH